jgi:hypothetical protein
VCKVWPCTLPSLDPESIDQAAPININVDSNSVYTLRQNADQQAAGEPVVEVTIVDNQINSSGFLTIRLPDGSEQQITCSSVVPSLCPN